MPGIVLVAEETSKQNRASNKARQTMKNNHKIHQEVIKMVNKNEAESGKWKVVDQLQSAVLFSIHC